MPGQHEIGQSYLDTPRSPVSISKDSSRRGSSSLKQVFLEKHFEQPVIHSPQPRLTRKRAASLNIANANEPRISDPALSSGSTDGPPSSSSSTREPREQVCLCQPDPKIPRPRNAFILYRQHYQAQVVAQNPGLANPEISKIIGEQWREQTPEVKSDWKRLAEEEKQRHQRQYPGYRYQPRRAGKLNSTRPILSSLADDPSRCPRCNGRYISTPSTPSTLFTPSLRVLHRSDCVPPFTPPLLAEAQQKNPQAQMQNTRMDPRLAQSYPQSHRRPGYPSSQPLQSHHERDEDMDLLSPSPGKRRRFNDENQRGYTANSPISYTAPQQYARGLPMSAGYRQQLPGPGVLVRSGPMGPLSQQSPMHQQVRHQYPTRSGNFDESLRLPPLQTQVGSSTPTITHRPDARIEAREVQARSVEAMVMTIPYANKIKVLTKIAPPLAPAGPTSPAQEVRGAVIAVEGADKILLGELGEFIKEHLGKDSSCAIKTWATEESSLQLTGLKSSDTEMTDASTTPEEKQPFVDYLSVISDWHRKSQQMIKYITTRPSRPLASAQVNTFSSSWASAPELKVIPIALAPNGFSLTTSDFFALRIPINDSYAPVDHWQWMATLWRGIVGPDLTIYVTRVGRDEMNKYGGVEIRGDCSTIVVRILEGGKMDEKTSRRLGFEVLEFVRNIESGFSRT